MAQQAGVTKVLPLPEAAAAMISPLTLPHLICSAPGWLWTLLTYVNLITVGANGLREGGDIWTNALDEANVDQESVT